mmetsp:Transcript_21786/g.47450  ORF Transcript_21786/g.47450 Transcript_21786/m.47450 type:complete len:222 (+) Transcript_21786:215-880(+)
MMYPMQHLLAILLAGARITAIATDAVAADGPVEKVQSRGLLDPPQSRTGPLNDQKYNNSLNSPNPLQRPPPPLPLLPAEHGGSAIIILANPATKAQPQPRVRLSSSNGSSSTSSQGKAPLSTVHAKELPLLHFENASRVHQGGQAPAATTTTSTATTTPPPTTTTTTAAPTTPATSQTTMLAARGASGECHRQVQHSNVSDPNAGLEQVRQKHPGQQGPPP